MLHVYHFLAIPTMIHQKTRGPQAASTTSADHDHLAVFGQLIVSVFKITKGDVHNVGYIIGKLPDLVLLAHIDEKGSIFHPFLGGCWANFLYKCLHFHDYLKLYGEKILDFLDGGDPAFDLGFAIHDEDGCC